VSSIVTPPPRAPGHAARPAGARRRREGVRATSLFAHGEPWVWLTGGALALALVMIIGLLALVLYQGLPTFWPAPVVQIETLRGAKLMGEVTTIERFRPEEQVFEALPEELRTAARDRVASQGGWERRRLVRSGNYDLTGTHFTWVSDHEVEHEQLPPWALVIERLSWGRFFGVPKAMHVEGEVHGGEPREVWELFGRHHADVRARWLERRSLERHDIGRVNGRLEAARLALREVELEHGRGSPQWQAAKDFSSASEQEAQVEFERITAQIRAIDEANARYKLVLETADGQELTLGLEQIVRAYPANQLGLAGRMGVYTSRAHEFLTDEPREANSEGGVFPAIFGTVVMTLVMSILVVPFGVLAALYLREYAKQGTLVSIVRIAVNNLAGVPSIVFGVFGLGFFCYIVGASIDDVLFQANLPNPTFGKGGLLWASLTLALLTLPVVIVPTEEALSAVPSSMREGSYACGATKWQTIRRIVLPRAMPGIMTGMILAMARGAGEVAPLMLVGAVKLAPELPIDGEWPFMHAQRSFMHLGFHIYDLGFQSQNSEAAKPMVYTTTLLLIGIVVLLNLLAIWIRARLRRRFQGASGA
jgi:phosphate transport system permease protein